MANLLMDIADYLVASNVALSDQIFRDGSPDTPDYAIILYEYAGNVSIPQVDTTLRSLQVVVRDFSPTISREKANEIYNLFKTEDGVLSITLDRWCMPHLRQSPFKLKVDTKNRVYYAFNLGMTTYND